MLVPFPANITNTPVATPVQFLAEVCKKRFPPGQARSLEDCCLEDAVRADAAACHGGGIEFHHDVALSI